MKFVQARDEWKTEATKWMSAKEVEEKLDKVSALLDLAHSTNHEARLLQHIVPSKSAPGEKPKSASERKKEAAAQLGQIGKSEKKLTILPDLLLKAREWSKP